MNDRCGFYSYYISNWSHKPLNPKRTFCLSRSPGFPQGCFGFGFEFVTVPEVIETASKRTEGKEVEKERQTSAYAFQIVDQGRPLQECKVVCFWGKVFLLEFLESPVHFEHLSDCHSVLVPEVIAFETASEESRGERGGSGRSKRQRAHSKERLRCQKEERISVSKTYLFLRNIK